MQSRSSGAIRLAQLPVEEKVVGSSPIWIALEAAVVSRFKRPNPGALLLYTLVAE